jgi:hypothetical protein
LTKNKSSCDAFCQRFECINDRENISIHLYDKNKLFKVTYSVISGAFLSVMNIQLVKIVIITNALNSEWVKIRRNKRRKQLNGENIKQLDVELNRKIVLFRLIITKI